MQQRAPVVVTPRAPMANAIRFLAADAVEKAKSGHPGLPMGMADAVAVLYDRFVTIDPSAPNWPDRDRVVFSAGHGSMLVYAVLHLLGFADFSRRELESFRQLGSRTAGHPEYGHGAGIETTTGPLGQGLANAVGMALAERMENARFGDGLVDHWTYVVCGDGCLMEGISHEAIDFAGHQELGRLIVLWDDNGITIDGSTDLSTSTDQLARFAAAGWHAVAVDGHDAEAVAAAIEAARAEERRPSLIACRTVIGYGAPTKAGSYAAHGAPLGVAEIAGARAALVWSHEPFAVPDEARERWRAVAERGRAAREAWEARLAGSDRRAGFEAGRAAPDRRALAAAIAAHKQAMSEQKPSLATRVSSQKALEVVNATLPNMVGGSADLTGSNNTKTSGMRAITRDDRSGDYIHWGIREHAMAAGLNGMALHGGFIPYGGTFLCFADYSRPAIRLSALMGVRAIHVMTHDSIGLGEDGPTHQPVEHLASLRAIPGLLTIRPADAVEAAEAWEVAVTEDGPSVLVLSRQNLPTLRTEHVAENRLARGAYVLSEPDGGRDVTLLATGSEVAIAAEAAGLLAAEGVRAAVVSAPSLELFARQDAAYRAAVLGEAPRVAVEAAVRLGWDALLGANGAFVGMSSFGASGPAPLLYEHFGITPRAVADAARTCIAAGRASRA